MENKSKVEKEQDKLNRIKAIYESSSCIKDERYAPNKVREAKCPEFKCPRCNTLLEKESIYVYNSNRTITIFVCQNKECDYKYGFERLNKPERPNNKLIGRK